MGGLGTVSLGQNSVGNFRPAIFVAPTGDAGAASTAALTTGARLFADSASGGAADTTLGVVRDVSASGNADATSTGTLGVTRSLLVEPGTINVDAGLGSTTLGKASVGGFQETTGRAGARTTVTGGIIRDLPIGANAGVASTAALTTGTRLFADSASGGAADTTLGIIRGLPIGANAGAAQTTTLGVLQRVSVASDAGAAPTVKLFRGVLGDHLFVALGEAKVVSVAVGLRRRGNNPDL